MKKLIYLTLMLIVIPTLIVSLIRPKEKDTIEKLYTFEKNTKVRVKRVNDNRIDTIPLEQYLEGVL